MSENRHFKFHKTRFAPSPTGYLHRGHILSAAWVWGFAQTQNIDVILRIEDHDQSRCRGEYVDAIQQDLSWLGFTWNEISQQSKHPERYQNHLERLIKKGLAYPCSCTRKQVGDGRYLGTCRDSNQDNRNTNETGIRIKLEEQTIAWTDLLCGNFSECPQQQCGDLLAQDRLGQWTYQFAVTVDDWEEGIDLVVRGMDLLDSTARQLQLAHLLGRANDPSYLHHPLIVDAQGEKLSKRQLARSIRAERIEGIAPEILLGNVCAQGGLIAKARPVHTQELGRLITTAIQR